MKHLYYVYTVEEIRHSYEVIASSSLEAEALIEKKFPSHTVSSAHLIRYDIEDFPNDN